jgi:hypothetical protein
VQQYGSFSHAAYDRVGVGVSGVGAHDAIVQEDEILVHSLCGARYDQSRGALRDGSDVWCNPYDERIVSGK